MWYIYIYIYIYIKFHNSDSGWLYVHPLLTSLSNCAQEHTLHVIRCLTNGLTIKTEQHVSTKMQDCRVNGTSHKHAIQCCYGSSEGSFNTCTQHGSDRVWTQWHIHARKIGATMRSKNSSQKHAATIFVNCEVCQCATQRVRLPMWLHKHILPVDNWFTTVLQTTLKKTTNQLMRNDSMPILFWNYSELKCLYSMSYPYLQQFHLTFHQQ